MGIKPISAVQQILLRRAAKVLPPCSRLQRATGNSPNATRRMKIGTKKRKSGKRRQKYAESKKSDYQSGLFKEE
ncbi:MAG: hypothetical protein IJ417_05590 [Bacteroidaceae bacterium]|nr:hypothetical protein [Bacteroidaceae bacterium]